MNHCRENALVTVSNDPIAAHDLSLDPCASYLWLIRITWRATRLLPSWSLCVLPLIWVEPTPVVQLDALLLSEYYYAKYFPSRDINVTSSCLVRLTSLSSVSSATEIKEMHYSSHLQNKHETQTGWWNNLAWFQWVYYFEKCFFLRHSVSKCLKEMIKSKLTCSSKLALTPRLYFDHFQNQFQTEQNYLFF